MLYSRYIWLYIRLYNVPQYCRSFHQSNIENSAQKFYLIKYAKRKIFSKLDALGKAAVSLVIIITSAWRNSRGWGVGRECGNTAGNMPTENFLQCIPGEIVLTASWDTCREYWIIYRRTAFLAVVLGSSPHPLPHSFPVFLRIAGRSHCRERGGGGAKSYDSEKAWFSIHHLMLSEHVHRRTMSKKRLRKCFFFYFGSHLSDIM